MPCARHRSQRGVGQGALELAGEGEELRVELAGEQRDGHRQAWELGAKVGHLGEAEHFERAREAERVVAEARGAVGRGHGFGQARSGREERLRVPRGEETREAAFDKEPAPGGVALAAGDFFLVCWEPGVNSDERESRDARRMSERERERDARTERVAGKVHRLVRQERGEACDFFREGAGYRWGRAVTEERRT
jgi:hypothetical protein